MFNNAALVIPKPTDMQLLALAISRPEESGAKMSKPTELNNPDYILPTFIGLD